MCFLYRKTLILPIILIMKISRKSFLIHSLKLTLGSILFYPILKSGETKGGGLAKSFNSPNPSEWKDTELNIAWIGHSTILMNLYGTIIVTDPVLFDKIGVDVFGFTIGQSRYSKPALEIDKFPRPDIVLLSHAHFDHMDYKTLNSFTDMYPGRIDCITATNTSDVISDLNWKSLKELDWNETDSFGDIKISAIEVKHFGWRYPFERDRSRGYHKNGRSFNAYLIEKNSKKVLFGGDTALTDTFTPFGGIDVAIMPIGAYNPWKRNHCNPEEALKMAAEGLKAKVFIPIHCCTFRQGLEPIDEPLKWLSDSVNNYNITLGLDQLGGTFTLNQ
jgi:L-ascorbate metabolism protein UlaG (beta-lactamase superfamily)